MLRHYPGLSEPPIIKTAAELATYQQAFKVGACEPAPCPWGERSDLEGTLPGQPERVAAVTGNLFHGVICQSLSPANGLLQVPQASDPTRNFIAEIGTNWCPCPGGGESRESRIACMVQSGCLGISESFGAGAWHEITTTTTTDTTWTSPMTPTRLSAALVQNHPGVERMWDYTALPSAFLNTGRADTLEVEGLLWNSVLDVPISDSTLHEQVVTRGQYFHDGSGSYVPTACIDYGPTWPFLPPFIASDPCPQGLICPSLVDFWRFRDELVSPILDPSQIQDVLDLAFVPSRTIPTIKDALVARDLDTINILRDPRIGDVLLPTSLFDGRASGLCDAHRGGGGVHDVATTA